MYRGKVFFPSGIRALNALAPAPVKAAAEPAPPLTAPAAPMRRTDPPEGYREAIAARRATWNTTQSGTRPEVQAVAERQLRNGSGSRRIASPTAARPLRSFRAKAAAQRRSPGAAIAPQQLDRTA